MPRIVLARALIVIGALSIFSSCDDQNIVEPRFYDNVGPNNIHVAPGRDVILVTFDVPSEVQVQISVIGGGGNLVKELTDGYYYAGCHQVSWDLTDQDGKAVSDGVYGFYIIAGDYAQVAWFELDT